MSDDRIPAMRRYRARADQPAAEGRTHSACARAASQGRDAHHYGEAPAPQMSPAFLVALARMFGRDARLDGECVVPPDDDDTHEEDTSP